MKFSVLLPTRNRLELLRYAIETVRRQDYGDWEIIVSDNASEEDVAGHVRSLGDARIRYYRTESFVPVTDNWNNALQKSTGDYVVMLGDDDCLMKGYFSTLRRIIDGRGRPDFIYYGALLFAYPGVMPGFPEGFVQSYGYADFLKHAKEPFWLDRAAALRCVQKSMNFMVSFGFNMQFALISRGIIGALRDRGDFFQSPYPDYYAMNALMLKAERILVCPQPLVTIGISPKSFGFYYFNQAERQGVEFLKNIPDPETSRRLEHVILPGTDMNTSWLIAMETLRLNYQSEAGLEVNYGRYRFLQILQVYAAFSLDRASTGPRLRELREKLRFGEKCLGSVLWAMALVAGVLPSGLRRKVVARLLVLTGVLPLYSPKKVSGRYRNILEVFDSVDPLAGRSAAAKSAD